LVDAVLERWVATTDLVEMHSGEQQWT